MIKYCLVQYSESAAVKLLAKKLASLMQEENWDNWPSLSCSSNSDPPQGCSTHPGTPITSSPTTFAHDVRLFICIIQLLLPTFELKVVSVYSTVLAFFF